LKRVEFQQRGQEEVKELLDDMKYGHSIDFLKKLELSECNCIIAIKYSLKRSTILLKRSPSEIRINNFIKFSTSDNAILAI